MKKKLVAFACAMLVGGMFVAPTILIAEEAVKAPAAAAPAVAAPVAAAPVAAAPAAAVAAPAEEVSLGGIFEQLAKVFADFKVLGWQAGLAALLTLLISSFKNSFVRGFLWDKLPPWVKSVVPYLLASVAVVIGLGKFDLASLMLALTTGAGAVAIHQLLDGLKTVPFIGAKWVWLVDLIAKLLKKPVKSPQA